MHYWTSLASQKCSLGDVCAARKGTKSQTSNRMSCDIKQSNRKQSPKVAVWYPKGWERVTNCDHLSQSCLWSQRSIHVFINHHQQMCIWAIITLWSLLNDWEDKAVGGGGGRGGYDGLFCHWDLSSKVDKHKATGKVTVYWMLCC